MVFARRVWVRPYGRVLIEEEMDTWTESHGTLVIKSRKEKRSKQRRLRRRGC